MSFSRILSMGSGFSGSGGQGEEAILRRVLRFDFDVLSNEEVFVSEVVRFLSPNVDSPGRELLHENVPMVEVRMCCSVRQF